MTSKAQRVRTNNKAHGRAGERPVKSGIHRAAKRIGLEPPIPLETVELVMLRRIVKTALTTFESEGYGSPSAKELLGEALRCARDEFDLIGDAQAAGTGVESMVYARAYHRTRLAIELAEYLETFGHGESEEERKVRESFDRMEAAQGGAS
jgi:hypothetical protein